MHYAETAVVALRAAEKDECAAGAVAGETPLDAFEEDHFHPPAAVRHGQGKTLDGIETDGAGPGAGVGRKMVRLAFGTDAVKECVLRAVETDADDAGDDLDLSFAGVELRDGAYAAAVSISERVEMQQVIEGAETQLLLQQLRPLGPHARQKLNVIIEAPHNLSLFFTMLRHCSFFTARRHCSFITMLPRRLIALAAGLLFPPGSAAADSSLPRLPFALANLHIFLRFRAHRKTAPLHIRYSPYAAGHRTGYAAGHRTGYATGHRAQNGSVHQEAEITF